MVCPRCNPPEPLERGEPVSHHDLARTVRRLKGLLLVSIMFGLFVAPFAIWIATRALYAYGSVGGIADPATRRQLVMMRRIAIGLLVLWAFLLGAQLGSWQT